MASTPRTPSTSGPRRKGHPLLVPTVAALVVMLVVVALTGKGTEVLIVLGVIVGLFLFERFVSDWVADVLGPMAGTWLLAALLLLVGVLVMSQISPKPMRELMGDPLGGLLGREGGVETGHDAGSPRPVLSPIAGSSRTPDDAGSVAAGSRPRTDRSSEPRGVAAEPTVELAVEPATPQPGETARVVVLVRSEAGLVRGEIAVDINRTEAGRLMSTDGTAAWTTRFPEGRFRLEARYLGGWGHPASRSAPVIVDVGGP